jgi:acetyl-CoA carboxylase carboxyl transferase subunit beta
MQMPRTTVAVQMLKEAGLPYIVVLTHPTTGGVTASYAMLGDVQIAEPNALICFAGPAGDRTDHPRKAARGFQRAEYLLDHGMLDRVTHRARDARRADHDHPDADGPAPGGKGDLPAARRGRRKPTPAARPDRRRAASRPIAAPGHADAKADVSVTRPAPTSSSNG